jgi:Cu/Ag efflux protein CusF
MVSMLVAPAAMAVAGSPESGRMATAAGVISSIDAAGKSLVVKVAEPGGEPQELNLVIAEDSKIIKNGAAISLGDLKEGDKVTITYEAQEGKNLVINIGVETKS